MTRSPERNGSSEENAANTLHSELFALAYPLATAQGAELEKCYAEYAIAIKNARQAGLDEGRIQDIITMEEQAFSASFPELS